MPSLDLALLLAGCGAWGHEIHAFARTTLRPGPIPFPPACFSSCLQLHVVPLAVNTSFFDPGKHVKSSLEPGQDLPVQQVRLQGSSVVEPTWPMGSCLLAQSVRGQPHLPILCHPFLHCSLRSARPVPVYTCIDVYPKPPAVCKSSILYSAHAPTDLGLQVLGLQEEPDPSRALFTFGSVFKWESRKGWDVLLSAFLNEFTVKDKVGSWKPDGRDTWTGEGGWGGGAQASRTWCSRDPGVLVITNPAGFTVVVDSTLSLNSPPWATLAPLFGHAGAAGDCDQALP